MSGLPTDPGRDPLQGETVTRSFMGLYGRTVSAGWMITFADLLALLVSFFVLLFATTTVEPEAWRRIVQPMRPHVAGTVLHPQETAPVVAAVLPAQHDLNYLEVLLRQLQGTNTILAGMGVERREHALVLHLPAGLQQAASPTDTDTARAVTDLGRLLAALDNRLEVVAHGSPAGSDLALASASKNPAAPWTQMIGRANATAGMLAGAGVTRPITVTGLLDMPVSSTGVTIDIVLHDQRGADVPAGGATP